MQTACPPLGAAGRSLEERLPNLIEQLAEVADLDATAARYGALIRRRGVPSAEVLLKLAFLYGLGGYSFRTTAALAHGLGIVSLTDTAILERLRRLAPWLEHLLAGLLERRALPAPLAALDRALTIVDGTSLSLPGSTGTDWRLHLRYDPVAGRLVAVRIGDAHDAESLTHFPLRPRDLVLGDRFYAKAKALIGVIDQGGDFLVRTGWSSLRLYDADTGQLFVVPDRLLTVTDEEAHEFRVLIESGKGGKRRRIAARLIVRRKPPDHARRATAQAKRKASKAQKTMRPETALAANFLMLVTSLDGERFPAPLVLALYRLRWQVELAIKRLKGLVGIKAIPVNDPDLVQVWLLIHLIAAVLVEDIASHVLAFSPSATRHNHPAAVPVASAPDRAPADPAHLTGGIDARRSAQ